MTFSAYLCRVVLSLLAFGGIAALAFWGVDVGNAFQSAFAAKRGDEDDGR